MDIPQLDLQVEHETFPACAYAALEFCQRHLAAVKKQLVQVSLTPHRHVVMSRPCHDMDCIFLG